MANNNTKKLKKIVTLANKEAKRLGNMKIMPEHLFLGLMRMKDRWAVDLLLTFGVDIFGLEIKVEKKISRPDLQIIAVPEFFCHRSCPLPGNQIAGLPCGSPARYRGYTGRKPVIPMQKLFHDDAGHLAYLV